MKQLALLLLLAAAPLDRAARDHLAETERATTRLRQESATAASSSAVARRRTVQAAASLVAIAGKVQAAERRLRRAERALAAVERERRLRRERLAQQQEEATRVLAVLQTMARRPAILAVVQPGSASDLAHTRMALDAMLPDLRARTASLRRELAASETMLAKLAQARDRAASEGVTLARSRAALALAESSSRQDAVELSAKAVADRRQAARLAVDAVSLRDLVSRLSADGADAQAPRLRSPVVGDPSEEADAVLPNAVTLETLSGAQVVAPAAGRVAFAGPFRSYGGVVIIDHGGGWRSIVSGLGAVTARPGQIVASGAPLARMPARSPRLHLELRNRSGAADPLPYLATACRNATAFAHMPGRAMRREVSRIEDRCRVSS